MGNWQNTFSGQTVGPAQAAFSTLNLTANTALVWPLESSEGTPAVAAEMNVVPSAGNLSLAMPNAMQGSTGIISLINNTGSASFTLTDANGNQIAVIAVGVSWLISLTANGTTSGTWMAVQLGATTSNAQAGALAGLGLQAVLTQLQSFIETFELNTSTAITAPYRAGAIVWSGSSAGTLALDTIANLTAGWWCIINNLGTGVVTLSAAAGQTINGVASVQIPVGGSGNPYSLLVVCASDGFYTFAGTPAIIPIDGGGTGAITAGQALINLGGSTIGIEIFEAPNAAAILAILGIGASAFTELTVASTQTLTLSSANNAFVATLPITLILPSTGLTGLTNQYLFAVSAQGGAVTLQPNGSDNINGANANFIIPQGASALLVTDAAGNWWPLFLTIPSGMLWAIATGTGDAIAVAYSPVDTALKDGMQRSFRAPGANATTAPTLADSALGPITITKNGGQSLVPNDIPGSGAECLVQYCSATTSWELLNPTTNLDLIGNVQGDILYRDSAVWKVLGPGAANQVLLSGGAAANPSWGPNTGRLISITKYLANGVYSYTVPAGCNSLYVEAVGSGGGGAGAAVGASQYESSGGGGGGAGGFTSGTLSGGSYIAGATVTVTIGTGGVGGTGNANGNSGNNTSFGAGLIVTGGVYGVAATVNSSSGLSGVGNGGAGGVVSTAGNVLSVGGNPGDYGIGQNKSFGSGGNGGSGPYGGAGIAGTTIMIATQIAGGNGAGPGSGGGGAGVYSNGASQTANGGNGADGGVIIYAYS